MPAWWSASHCRQCLEKSGPDSMDLLQSAPPHQGSLPAKHNILILNINKSTQHSALKYNLTLMLFLKVYPGKGKPFFLSIGSLKMTSCSNRKTRLSLALDRKPLSCSLTEKVSCWSSFPWAVIFPWAVHISYTIVKEHKSSRICVLFFKNTLKNGGSYLKTLEPSHIHHIITSFWHKTHNLHCSLSQMDSSENTILVCDWNDKAFYWSFHSIMSSYLQLLHILPSFAVILQEVLKVPVNKRFILIFIK